MARLDQICFLNMGQSPESSSYNEEAKGIPFFQGNADFGVRHPNVRVWCDAPTKIAQTGDILVSVRAPIGALNIANTECCIGRGLAALAVDKKVCLNEYLWHAMASKVDELNAKGTGSTFKAISKNVLAETEIPLPSLAEQRDIATVLDKVGEMISLRKQQLAKLDELVKSRFVELFGDLKTNPYNWECKKLLDVADIDTTMVSDYEKYADYPHIGIDSIEKNTGRLLVYRTIAEDDVISGKYLFTRKHIIYSKIRPNLNKVALPDFEGLCSADAYPILPKENVCLRIYLGYVMRSEFFLDYILPFSRRANMPKVNKEQLSGFVLPVPDIKLQNQFATFVEQTDKSKLAVQRSLDKLETLKKALMQKYFG